MHAREVRDAVFQANIFRDANMLARMKHLRGVNQAYEYVVASIIFFMLILETSPLGMGLNLLNFAYLPLAGAITLVNCYLRYRQEQLEYKIEGRRNVKSLLLVGLQATFSLVVIACSLGHLFLLSLTAGMNIPIISAGIAVKAVVEIGWGISNLIRSKIIASYVDTVADKLKVRELANSAKKTILNGVFDTLIAVSLISLVLMNPGFLFFGMAACIGAAVVKSYHIKEDSIVTLIQNRDEIDIAYTSSTLAIHERLELDNQRIQNIIDNPFLGQAERQAEIQQIQHDLLPAPEEGRADVQIYQFRP
jgi:hypothetical protein